MTVPNPFAEHGFRPELRFWSPDYEIGLSQARTQDGSELDAWSLLDVEGYPANGRHNLQTVQHLLRRHGLDHLALWRAWSALAPTGQTEEA